MTTTADLIRAWRWFAKHPRSLMALGYVITTTQLYITQRKARFTRKTRLHS